MNKENLLKFASTIKNFNNLKHATRILWIGYYLQNNENYDFFKNTDVGECYELLDLNPPSNPSDSLKKLKEANNLVQKGKGYRVAKSDAEKMQSILEESSLSNRLEKVYNPGQSYEFYDDIKKLISSSKSEVFLIDSYATEDIIDLYLSKLRTGIKIMILTKDPKGNFVSVAQKFKMKHGKNFTVKINKNCHDRVFFVDKQCYVTGQSLDKAASNQPTYLCEIDKKGSFRSVFQHLFDKGKTLF